MAFGVNKCLAAVVGLGLGLGAAANASATALAQSTLQVTNFQFQDSTGAVLPITAFTNLVITDSTNLNPTLNGTGPGGQTSFNTVGGVPLGFHELCIPACPIGQPAPFADAVVPPTQDGALAASNLSGSPLTGFPGVSTPALAQTEAIAQNVNPGTADSAATLGLTASFEFSLAQAQAIQIDFDAIIHQIDFLDSALLSARTGSTWTFNITNRATGATVFSWSPDGVLSQTSGITGGTEIADTCNLQATRSRLGAGTTTFDCTGAETAITNILASGITYDVSLNHQVSANTILLPSRVPEPGTLALLGIGVLSAGMGLRRRKSN